MSVVIQIDLLLSTMDHVRYTIPLISFTGKPGLLDDCKQSRQYSSSSSVMAHPSIAKVTCNFKIMKRLPILTTRAHSNTIGNEPMCKKWQALHNF